MAQIRFLGIIEILQKSPGSDGSHGKVFQSQAHHAFYLEVPQNALLTGSVIKIAGIRGADRNM